MCLFLPFLHRNTFGILSKKMNENLCVCIEKLASSNNNNHNSTITSKKRFFLIISLFAISYYRQNEHTYTRRQPYYYWHRSKLTLRVSPSRLKRTHTHTHTPIRQFYFIIWKRQFHLKKRKLNTTRICISIRRVFV